jgi:hypothetical protein
MAHHGELSSRAARGFNRSLHVSKQKIVPDYGPVYVGQTFEVPVTVIAQAQSGVVCVLAVFTSEQISLRISRLLSSRGLSVTRLGRFGVGNFSAVTRVRETGSSNGPLS